MQFDELLINELINCEKQIIHPPAALKLEKGHYRIGFELQSNDRKYFFKAFGRYNAVFNENFSVGLIYFPQHEKGSYEVIRCNGPHGEHIQFPHHTYYHIHKASSEAINVGFKEDRMIEITDKYTNYEEALRFFVQYINVNAIDIERYFPPKQLSMFE